jgi:hypothetical protein
MKKIYLLSAAACMFALNANAGGAEDLELFKASNSSVQEMEFNAVSNCVSFKVSQAGDPWSAQFNPPTWIAPSKGKSEAFEICFDAMYVGAGTDAKPNTGDITFIQGRQFGGLPADAVASTCAALGIEEQDAAWKIQNIVEQLYVEEFDGQAEDFAGGNLTRNVHFYPTAEWAHFSMKGTLGRHAADSVDLEFEFGSVAGVYSVKNFQFIVKGTPFAQYFMASNTAVAETAAIKAYVANDVLYASEAADVVVYNINGVAVKAAKNVTSLNVADLKAGLYIAKFGNATVKFVK